MNDWLHKIHDRMADYETAEPDGLWSSIEENLSRVRTSRRSRPLPIFFRQHKAGVAAALAAVVAIPIGLFVLRDKPSVQTPVLLSKLSDTACDKQSQTVKSVSELKQEYSAPAKPAHIIVASSPHPVIEDNNIAENSKPSYPTETPSEPPSNNISEKTDSAFTRNIYVSGKATDIKEYTASIANSSKGGKISVAVFGSGATSAAHRGTTQPVLINALGSDGGVWTGTPLLGMLLYNQGLETESRINHHQPLKLGMSFTYRFNDRVGLETGLSYSILNSDIREGSVKHYVAGKQKLQYIGIPLNLKYRIFSWKKLDFYASAGGAAEMCVSAQVRREYILDKSIASRSTEDLHDKPLQWSVNAAIGLQCRLINSLSIYAEPGVSYYFNDGSNLRTIYKEKPTNFSLNLGVRYTIGN